MRKVWIIFRFESFTDNEKVTIQNKKVISKEPGKLVEGWFALQEREEYKTAWTDNLKAAKYFNSLEEAEQAMHQLKGLFKIESYYEN